MSDEKKLLALAKSGKIDAIFKLTGSTPESDEDEDGEVDSGDADHLAYKWLQVAVDFGHKDAADMADDMLETSSLRYDDDNCLVGLIHLELGEEYLSGKAALPVNLTHAKRHLAIAKELKVHKTTDVTKGFDATRRKLSAESR